MSMLLVSFYFRVLLTNLIDVTLSTCTACWPFSNDEAILYSAAEATMFLIILHSVCIGALSFSWDFSMSSMKSLGK